MEIVWFLLLMLLAAVGGGYVGNLSANYARKKRGEHPISFWTGRPKAHKPVPVDFEEPAWGVVLEVSMVVYAKDRECAIEEAYSQVINPNQEFLTASLVDLYSIEEDTETS